MRVVLGLAATLILVAFACLDGVDYEPYFRCDYYNDSMARLQAAATNVALVTGELEAGFGRAQLTPTLGVPVDIPVEGKFRSLPLAGYGARKGRPAVGVHDDLWVKAMAFRVQGQVAVMISADALIIPREVTEQAMARISQDLHLRREQIYLSATHSHAGLGGWGEGLVAEAFAGGFQPGVRVWMADRIVAACRAALADLTPASLGQGSFVAPEFIRNRTVGSLGRVDSEFAYLYVRQADGDVGVVGCYGAHATVLPSSNMEWSGDYPGVWQTQVERSVGGLAMFMAGGVGSHAPVPGASAHAGTERMGTALSQALLSRLPNVAVTNRITLGFVGLEATLPPENVRLTDGIRLRPWLARRLLPVGRRSFFQALRLQDGIWASSPCDFSGELALGIKDAFRPRGFRTVITSFNGDYVGYVLSSRYYHLNGYESRVMSFFGPNVPDYFDGLIRDLATALQGPGLPQD